MAGFLIKLNNWITGKRWGRFEPHEILLLIPHCLQVQTCQHNVRGDLQNCQRCGQCPIDAMLNLAEKYGIASDRVIVEEGTPEFVIHDAAKQTGAGVVVMGTVARQGLKGMLVGNSAESVLENSEIDVMVVKLPDFRCPIEF